MRPWTEYVVQLSAAVTASAFVAICIFLLQLRDGQAEIRGILNTYAKGDAAQERMLQDHEVRIRDLEVKAR